MTCSGWRYTTSAKGTNGRWDTGRKRRSPEGPSLPPPPIPPPLLVIPLSLHAYLYWESTCSTPDSKNAIRQNPINQQRELTHRHMHLFATGSIRIRPLLNRCSRQQVEADPALSYPMLGIQNSCIWRRQEGKKLTLRTFVSFYVFLWSCIFVLLSLWFGFFLLVQCVGTSMPLRIQQFFFSSFSSLIFNVLAVFSSNPKNQTSSNPPTPQSPYPSPLCPRITTKPRYTIKSTFS